MKLANSRSGNERDLRCICTGKSTQEEAEHKHIKTRLKSVLEVNIKKQSRICTAAFTAINRQRWPVYKRLSILEFFYTKGSAAQRAAAAAAACL